MSESRHELTPAEHVFMRRMLPHFLSGKSAEAAALAVLDDDARLLTALCERRHSEFVPTADERGRAVTTRIGTGDLISTEITRAVYARLNADEGLS